MICFYGHNARAGRRTRTFDTNYQLQGDRRPSSLTRRALFVDLDKYRPTSQSSKMIITPPFIWLFSFFSLSVSLSLSFLWFVSLFFLILASILVGFILVLFFLVWPFLRPRSADFPVQNGRTSIFNSGRAPDYGDVKETAVYEDINRRLLGRERSSALEVKHTHTHTIIIRRKISRRLCAGIIHARLRFSIWFFHFSSFGFRFSVGSNYLSLGPFHYTRPATESSRRQTSLGSQIVHFSLFPFPILARKKRNDLLSFSCC